MRSGVLRINPAIRTCPFDGAVRDDMVLCEIPRGRGSAARFLLPATTLEVLELFDGHRETRDIARQCTEEGTYTQDELNRLIHSFFVPRGFLLSDDASDASATAEAKPKGRLSYLLLRVRVIPPSVVRPIAMCLGWMYRSPVRAAWIVAMIVAHAIFYLHLGLDEVGTRPIQGSHAALITVIVLFGTVLHELGHAAAAVRFGCRNVEIGFGLYYYYAVLYTDLSEAWRLPRKQRALIDAGGIYFQAATTVLLLIGYYLTHSPVPLYCFLVTDLAIASSLNPFFRMDGYWLVSDLLGVVNLRDHIGHTAEAFISRLLGTPESANDGEVASDALGMHARRFLGIYAAVSVAFFIFIFFVVIQRLVVRVFLDFPRTLAHFHSTVSAAPFDLLDWTSAAFSVLWRALLVFGAAKFLYRFSARVAGPARRVAAGVAGAWRARLTGRVPARSGRRTSTRIHP